ncbi:hypothetical protein KAW50_03590 [candidate division WOR-3 bacterium]|nr:hypothetical protein [candidate division WOR-3 bacterium]
MENKTTIELLELISKLEKQADKDPNGETDWEKLDEALEELRNREPFRGILGESDDPNDLTLQERIEELEDTVKELRRHKHYERSGDVMIRI